MRPRQKKSPVGGETSDAQDQSDLSVFVCAQKLFVLKNTLFMKDYQRRAYRLRPQTIEENYHNNATAILERKFYTNPQQNFTRYDQIQRAKDFRLSPASPFCAEGQT